MYTQLKFHASSAYSLFRAARPTVLPDRALFARWVGRFVSAIAVGAADRVRRSPPALALPTTPVVAITPSDASSVLQRWVRMISFNHIRILGREAWEILSIS